MTTTPDCPPLSFLLQLAAGEVVADGVARAHLAQCESCQALLAEFRLQVAGLRDSASGRAVPGNDCLDELALARLVEGVVDPAARERQVAHLATCGHCRTELAALAGLAADPAIARELGSASSRWHVPGRRAVLGLAGLAAAVLVAVTLVRSPDRGHLPEHRGPTITAADAPIPVAPVGEVASATELTWSAVAGADRYRVTLFRADGQVLLDAEVGDTVLVLPDSVALRPGESHFWQVEARTGPDRWTESGLMEFRLGSPPGDGAVAPVGDSLHLVAARLTDAELGRAVRTRSSEVREAIALLLARGTRAGSSGGSDALDAAHRLAVAHATAWGDDFLRREVERFRAMPAARRGPRVEADSLRRAGVAAFARDGADAALAAWRLALRRSAAIADTAGLAATLGNIGAAHAREGRLDSATAALERARALAARVRDFRVEGNALSELAGVAEQRGDLATATGLYGRAAELRRRVGDSRGMASDHNNLAGLARASGDLEVARQHLEAALALNRRDQRPEAAATNLVNLAGLASLAGDFARAEGMYREASATWRRGRRWAELADAERGLGELAIRRGDYPAARSHLREALVLYERTGPASAGLEVRTALARVRAAEGDLQGALDELAAAERSAEAGSPTPTVGAALVLGRAELAAELNERAAAARLHATAVRLYREAGDRGGEAEALRGEGAFLLEQDDPDGARARFEAALQAHAAGGDQRAAGLVGLWLAEAHLRGGDTAAARAEVGRAARELAAVGDPVSHAAALGEQAAVELVAGFPQAADSLYRAGVAVLGDRAAPEVRWRLHAGLARVREGEGRRDAAAAELRAAIAAIEGAARSLVLPERRSGYLADKWGSYARLALLERTRGRLAESFAVSERMRAMELRELLERGRVAGPADEAGDLVARVQDLRRHIAELTREADVLPAGRSAIRGPDAARGRPVAREALLRAQEEFAALRLELRERAPRRAALLLPEPPSWQAVAARLAAGEVFIEYLLGESGSLAYLVTRDTIAAVPLGASRRELARTVALARATLLPRGDSPLEDPWRPPLRLLHRQLITPLEASGLLASARRLIVAPHGELHYVPFAALLGGEGRGTHVVERYELVVTPSASVWLALRARPGRPAAAGILALAPSPDVLPGSEAEVAAITRLGGGDVRVLRGRAATEAAFRREAPSRRVLHLASFGVLNKQNPLFSFVQLAPGGTHDGELDAHEVAGLPLAADLVVLSACQTGLASGAREDVPAGDDWIGLTQAFLVAGAERVMGTLWPVEDRATAELMERFYGGYLPAGDPVRALAEAQRALLRARATASPYYWAGFVVAGGA